MVAQACQPALCQSEFDFVVDVARKLIACETSAETLHLLVRLIHGYWRPDAVSLARVKADGSLVFCAASGEMSDLIVGISLPVGCGIVGWVAETRRRLWVPDVNVDERFYGEVDQRTGFTTRAILAVPLMVGSDVLAVLEFINPEPQTDIRKVDDVVAALALLVSPAIANVELAERVDQAERRYQRLFELNLDPVVVLDKNGQVIEVNQSAKKKLGLSSVDVDRSDLACLGFDQHPFSELYERTQHEETVAWEYQLSDHDGDERYFEARLSHLSDYLPNEDLYLWIGHDITERVALENARQTFINMIVHDLRAPLSSVQNSLELVLVAWREQDMTMPVEQVLGIGLRSANRMGQLINDILDSAALQDRERILDISEIRVNELVDEAIETVLTSANRRGQHIHIDVAPDLPVVLGDVDLLRRVLVNLLTNAVKFTPEQGDVWVEAKAVPCTASVEMDEADCPCEVRFSVTDTGPGISLDIRENLFKLYVHTSDRRVKGTGIGLAFCKLAVEAHGGRIWFESPGSEDAPNGARFIFTIPQVPPVYKADDMGCFK